MEFARQAITIIFGGHISPDFREGGSEQIREEAQEIAERRFSFKSAGAPLRGWYSNPRGTSVSKKPLTDDVEGFLFMTSALTFFRRRVRSNVCHPSLVSSIQNRGHLLVE